jgi:hypothetical protein
MRIDKFILNLRAGCLKACKRGLAEWGFLRVVENQFLK